MTRRSALAAAASAATPQLPVDPDAGRLRSLLDAGFLAEAGWDPEVDLSCARPPITRLLGRPVCRAPG